MKYAFFGTPEFAKIVLEELIADGFPPALVVCNPDKPTGRKKIITPPPTKVLAKENEISVAQPETKESIANYLSNGFDFFVVAAYSKILPKEVIDLPKLGVIGVHPSLLPKYRGATPIQSAILAGETETGTTLFIIDEKVDHGKIVASSKQQVVNGDNYETLMKKLAHLSGKLLVETLPKFIAGKIKPKEQDHNSATFTKKFTTEDGFVDLKILRRACLPVGMAQDGEDSGSATEIERKVRALNPEPGVWTTKDGKRMKILEAELGDGKLLLKKIQFEGGRPHAF